MNTDHIEIYPYICVYNNLMQDSAELYSIADHLSNDTSNNLLFDWGKWSFFGTYGSAKGSIKDPALLDKANQNHNTNYFKEIKIYKRIQEITKTALNDYVQKYNVKLPEKSVIQEGVNIAKYDIDFDLAALNKINAPSSRSMDFHTDYSSDQIDKKYNFLITCNLYFNDDYTGGSIIFDIDKERLEYKPKAGDVVVFPSGSPLFFPNNKKYLHAVETSSEKNKFLSRNYIMHEN